MRCSQIQLLSKLRFTRRAAASSRFYTVSALNPNLSDSEQQQVNNHLKVGNFDLNLSNINEFGVLRVLNSTKDDPNLAFSFLGQLKQHGVSLNVNAYATVVKILSSWGLDRKLDSVLVELIRNEKRGFCVLDLIEAIGEEAEEEKRSFLVIRVSSALVKAYVSLAMFDKAVDVLFQNNRMGCVPCIKACNFLMNRLIEFGETDMVVGLFRQFKQLGLSANEFTYTIVIKAFCRSGDLEAARDLLVETSSAFALTTYIEGLCGNKRTEEAVGLIKELTKMKALAGDDLRTAYRMVVRGFCDEMKLEAAEEVIFKMEETGIGPDVHACSLVINRHRKNMNIPRALGFFEKMLEKGLKVNCLIVSSILQCYCELDMYWEALEKFEEYRDEKKIFLDRVCYNVAFDALSKLERVEEAIELLQEMMEKGMVPDVINYTTLIDGYFRQGRFVDAIDLMEEMTRNGTSPDVITYNVVAGGLARKGHVEEAFKIYQTMKDQGVKPSALTHNVIIEGLCSAREIQEAVNFFNGLENRCQENFNSLVKGYCLSGLSKKAFRVFTSLDFRLRKSVYFKLFTSLCNEGCPEKALDVLKRMPAYGVAPGRSMYGRMIREWCKLDKLREARLVFDTMVMRELIPDLFTYTIMIHTYCRGKELKKADDLLEDMKKRGIEPDVVTYTVLLDGHLKLDAEYHETGSVIGGVRKRKASEVFKELQDAGIELDVVSYTVLIDNQCKIPNLEKATKFFYGMIDSGLKPDVKTYSALICGYIRKGDMDKASTLFEELSREDKSLGEQLFDTVKLAISKTKRLQLR